MKKFLLPLLLIATSTSFAQKVSGKLHLSKGQKLEVTTNMNMNVQSMMGESSNSITMTEVDSVVDASANSITLLKTPKHLKANLSIMGKDILLDSDKPEDLNSPLGEPVKDLMKQKTEYTIDANGKVIAVKEDKKKNSNESGSMMGSMMMPGMNAAAALPKVGGSSFLRILPEKEVGKGDSWIDSVSTDGNKNKIIYTLKDITDKDIVVDYIADGTNTATQSAMGMSVDVTAKTKSSGSILVDRATSVLKQITATTTSESTMNMGGNEMNTTMKTTAVTNVKIL